MPFYPSTGEAEASRAPCDGGQPDLHSSSKPDKATDQTAKRIAEKKKKIQVTGQ